MNEVEAVKTRAEIAAIETLLRKHHGEIYADIWKVGLNLSLRISDLLPSGLPTWTWTGANTT